MALARQTVSLLEAARHLAGSLQADAVLVLTETDLDWGDVREHLGDCRLLVAAEDPELHAQFKANPDLTVLDIDLRQASTQERISLAVLEALMRGEKITRKPDDEVPRDQSGSAVPSAGGRFRPAGGAGPMEPQPQS